MRVKIIFIDDEEDILNILRLKFRKMKDHPVIGVELLGSAEEFEDFIINDDSDVISVISDINMPNNNVLDNLKKYKDRYNFVITYLCSAYSQDEYEDMMTEYNIEFFFKKPLDIADLKARILDDLKQRGINTDH